MRGAPVQQLIQRPIQRPIQIVIPMAGRGQRFRDAGYVTPKPLIELDGCTLIEIVVANVTPTRPHRVIVCALADHLADGSLERTLRNVDKVHVVREHDDLCCLGGRCQHT